MHDFELEAQPSRTRSDPGGPAPATSRRSGATRERPSATDGQRILDLQRAAGNAAVVQLLAEDEPSPVLDVVGKGRGTALDRDTRSAMESRFGTDFGDVRVHTDAAASRSAEAVGAKAYTVGNDIVFQAGRFDDRTLAHELTHVQQQRSGPVEGTDAPGGIRVSDPGDRFEREADATASHVTSANSTSATGSETATAQRDEDEDAVALQRDAVDDEDEEVPAG